MAEQLNFIYNQGERDMKKLAIASATGTGKKRTIPALENSKIIEVVGIQGRSPEKLKQIGDKDPRINTFSSIEEMIKETDPDVVFIGSPPFMHKEEIFAAAKSGKAIICEKPLAANLADANQIEEIINQRKNRFMLAHHIRHQKAISDVKNILKNNELGNIRTATLQWNFPVSMQSPSSLWKFGGENPIHNSFYDPGVHAIDLAIYFWGEPLEVYASGHKNLNLDTYDTVTCIFKYAKHTVILASSLAQTTIGNDLNINCEHGTIQIQDAFSEKSIKSILVRSQSGLREMKYEDTNLYAAEVENFACFDDVEKQSIGTTLAEAMLSMRLLDAISRSLRTSEVVKLSAVEDSKANCDV